MNTSQIKAYAPQARTDFIQAVTERAARFGIHEDHIEPIRFEGDVAIIGDQAVTQKEGEQREKLVQRVNASGFEMFIRSCAYTWFNRFVAIRYMELHDFLDHGYRVLSSPDGSPHPEIITHAADVDLPGLDREQVIELKLAGDRDNELFRMLLMAQCNALHKAMPFLFEKLDNEEALLLPDNLLHTGSPMHNLVTQVEEALWEDVEIIGWIYQFYISEKKDEVIGKQVKSEDIPAATQLFTPNWIVKYMVQNTLGRMWLATYPDSCLGEKMEYYIEPARQEPDVQKNLNETTPKELNPETLTFLDPACGSGHILVEAYDILKEIYLERGYRTREIPRLILEKNLFGIDIDKRAAQLANFAVMMRARNDDRRLFGREDLKSNIISITESKGLAQEKLGFALKIREVKDHTLKWVRIQELIELFEHAKTFGSLITIPDDIVEELDDLESIIESSGELTDDLIGFISGEELGELMPLVKQAQLLSKKYDCVVANPPYMGTKGMNPMLKAFAKSRYPHSKSDIFAMFTENLMSMTVKSGHLGLVMPYVWMFLSSYESLRSKIISNATISSLIQLEYNAFEPACVPVATFTFVNHATPKYKGSFIKLSDFKGHQNQAPKTLEAIQNPDCGWFFNASAADFRKIPGSPVAYWISGKIFEIFDYNPQIGEIAEAKVGLQTSDNDKFLRFWQEVNHLKIDKSMKSNQNSIESKQKWFPYNKGGKFRKWYGNQYYILNWENNGFEINQCRPNSVIRNPNYYFCDSVSWSDITSSSNSFRYFPKGFIHDSTGHSSFGSDYSWKMCLIAYCNNKFVNIISKILNPTFHFHIGYFNKLPYAELAWQKTIKVCAEDAIILSKDDWNSYETSWDFITVPLLYPDHHTIDLSTTYTTLRNHWEQITLKMQRLEEENNRIFIEAYDLEEELTPDVPLHEITLTCNPYYRYAQGKTEEAYETLLLTDTMKELISYAIGCMMGRYTLDEPGLIYAHSGNEGFYPSRYNTFPADDDGILPIMDMEWFDDDSTGQFITFMKTAWPADTLDDNLKFIADTLKPKAGESPEQTIRRYLSTTFFKDHMKMYKKRPIYWLFSSGKQRAFECLVYLHRYNESTLSRMRSKYVTPLQGNIMARLEYLGREKDAATTASAQKKLQKEMDLLRKKQTELQAFDDELRHYADMKITLDLDDGVKVNYGKFGNLLNQKKAITGKK